jgi:hypothetical protein
MTIELYCRRLGGGGAASDIMVEDYNAMPVPDLEKLDISGIPELGFLNRDSLIYFDEVKQSDRNALDATVLKAMGFGDHAQILSRLYSAFVEVVDDRLVKAGRSVQQEKETGD